MRGSAAVGWLAAIAVVGGLMARAGAGSPNSSPAEVVLSVTGKVPKPLSLDAEGFARLPRQTVRTAGHDGKEAVFEGVALHDVLRVAGLSLTADELRGPALEYYLVVEAADGYRAVFALPELSPAFTDRVVLLADRRDGKPLEGNEGHLRMIVPGEKRHGRWVRQVVRLKVGRD